MLESNLLGRKQKNARYSLRAFANQLDMHPSALSRILAGKQELSLRASLRVIKKLPLTDDEKRKFIASVAEEKYTRALATLSRAIGSKIDGTPTDTGALLEAALSFSPDRLMIMSLEGRVLLVTPGPMDFMSVPVEDAVGKTMHDIFPIATAQDMVAQDQLVMVTGRPSSMEFSVERESIEYFRRLATPVLGDDGEIEAVLLHIRKITAEKKSRVRAEMLQELTATLSQAVESADVSRAVTGQLMKTVGAQAISLNVLEGSSLTRIAAMPPQTSDAVQLPSAFPNPHADAFSKRVHLWFEDLTTDHCYGDFLNGLSVGLRAGAILPLMVQGRPIGTIGLGFTGTHSFSEEERTFLITVSTVCAEALERARLYEVERHGRLCAEAESVKFKTLLDHLPLLAWTVSPGGVVEYRNPKSREYFGNEVDKGAPAFTMSWWFQFAHPEDQERLAQETMAGFKSGKKYDLTVRLRGVDDSYQNFLCKSEPIVGTDGRILSWIGIAEPIP